MIRNKPEEAKKESQARPSFGRTIKLRVGNSPRGLNAIRESKETEGEKRAPEATRKTRSSSERGRDKEEVLREGKGEVCKKAPEKCFSTPLLQGAIASRIPGAPQAISYQKSEIQREAVGQRGAA